MQLFDNGWNAFRGTIFANQKRPGAVSEKTDIFDGNQSNPILS
jgi:hypothetical protein